MKPPTLSPNDLFPSLTEQTKARDSSKTKPPGPQLITGVDGLNRPAWVGHDPLLMDYYDSEWGTVTWEEQGLFETLSLLIFQAGMTWRSILLRRPLLRVAFEGFDPDRVAAFPANRAEALMKDPRVIRNPRKVNSILANAKATVGLRAGNLGTLPDIVWSFQPQQNPVNEATALGDLPVIPEAEALSAALRGAGFQFIGPKICFALMQAVGVVDTNPVGAWRQGSSGLWNEDGSRTQTKQERDRAHALSRSQLRPISPSQRQP